MLRSQCPSIFLAILALLISPPASAGRYDLPYEVSLNISHNPLLTDDDSLTLTATITPAESRGVIDFSYAGHGGHQGIRGSFGMVDVQSGKATLKMTRDEVRQHFSAGEYQIYAAYLPDRSRFAPLLGTTGQKLGVSHYPLTFYVRDGDDSPNGFCFRDYRGCDLRHALAEAARAGRGLIKLMPFKTNVIYLEHGPLIIPSNTVIEASTRNEYGETRLLRIAASSKSRIFEINAGTVNVTVTNLGLEGGGRGIRRCHPQPWLAHARPRHRQVK